MVTRTVGRLAKFWKILEKRIFITSRYRSHLYTYKVYYGIRPNTVIAIRPARRLILKLMSSNLSNILRRSRLAQVPKIDKPLVHVGKKHHPTHQVIETKPACLRRQEWGLKSSIPSKVKSRYIIFNELDTMERLTDFEPIGQYQWNRIRFQEMGISPKYPMKSQGNPLFYNRSLNVSSESSPSVLTGIDSANTSVKKKKVLQLVESMRPAFKKWLTEAYPEVFIERSRVEKKQLNKYASEFLSQNMDITSADRLFRHASVVGTGGLTYNLAGRLRQSPKGIKQINVVEGRILQTNNLEKSVAVAGFIAKASSLGRNARRFEYEMGDFVREHTFPFLINEAKVNEEGRIVLDVSLIEGRPGSLRKSNRTFGVPSSKLHVYQRGSIKERTVSLEESAIHAEELLSILTNFER
ncbi:mitochondrial 37S ribosomal protein bS1m Ecym_8296 [Eremothecium cymbalariae DBVPG|uniref:Uncharacterized protein n=1 Tax=Eremothecium cymbalariae (strain CBS 270.75 / DBVPG 7215 / KCTC 17166 / NRRL Y-17582) TaxID=931890 RepID=G8JXK1_ERECY|nr:Hypothetical protein Ecym_8296 [Eremothecium cymbalariae DBVPG\